MGPGVRRDGADGYSDLAHTRCMVTETFGPFLMVW
jgi:hypothetical protein